MSSDNKKQQIKQRSKIGKKVFLGNRLFKNWTPISQILEQLRKNSEDTLQTKTITIRMMRCNKEKEVRRAKTNELDQQCMKPGDAIPRVFSSSKPLNIGDRFLNEKQKSKLLQSERAFNKSANVVAGVYRERIRTQTQKQKKNWINGKFCDYDNIVTQQSGPMRMLVKQKTSQQKNLNEKRPIYSGKFQTKTNLFSDYESDKNNFFKETVNAKTIDSIPSKFKTQASLETSPSSKVLRTGPRKNKGQFKSTICRNFSDESHFFN